MDLPVPTAPGRVVIWWRYLDRKSSLQRRPVRSDDGASRESAVSRLTVGRPWDVGGSDQDLTPQTFLSYAVISLVAAAIDFSSLVKLAIIVLLSLA